jgi:hypothetical protein
MRSPATAALALFLTTITACLGVGDAPPPAAGPPAPVRRMLHGDAAMKEIAGRTGEGDVTADRTQNGFRTTKYEYPDGAVALISTGPGRKDYAFWPPAK